MLQPTDIFEKTPQGVLEVQQQSNTILPREARTLLILINGKNTYADFQSSLRDSAAFKSAGGIDQYIDLLLGLDYIQKQGSGAANPQPDQVHEEIVLGADAPTVQAQVVSLEQKREDKLLDSISNMVEDKPAISAPLSIDQARTTLAEIIEKSNGLQDEWQWLFKLEECDSPIEFVALIRGLRAAGMKSSRDLSKIESQLRRR